MYLDPQQSQNILTLPSASASVALSASSERRVGSSTARSVCSGRSNAERLLRPFQTAPTRALLQPDTFRRTYLALAASFFALESRSKATHTLPSPTRAETGSIAARATSGLSYYTHAVSTIEEGGGGCLHSMAEFGFATEPPAHERLASVLGLVAREESVSALADALRGLVLGSVRHASCLCCRRGYCGCLCRYKRQHARWGGEWCSWCESGQQWRVCGCVCAQGRRADRCCECACGGSDRGEAHECAKRRDAWHVERA